MTNRRREMEAENGGAQNCSPATLVLFPIPMAYEQSSHSAIQNDEHMDPNVKGEEGILQESDHSETLKEFKSDENVAEGEEDLASDGHFLGKEDTGDHTIEFRNLGNESYLKAFGDLCKTNGMVTKEVYYKSDLAIGLGDFDTLQSSQRAEIVVEREASENEELHGGGSSPEVTSREFFSSESRDNVENSKLFHIILEQPNVVGYMTNVDISNPASSSKNKDCKPSEATTDPSKRNMSLESLKPPAILESSGKYEYCKFDFDLNTDVGYEDLDCEQCLIPSNPVDLSAPTVVSASNGTLGPNIIPSYFESELVLKISAYTSSFHPASRSEDIMSDSKHRENFVERDLNMASNPPLVEEEDDAPPLLQLASSMQPSVRGIDLNDDLSNFDFVPVLTALDSRMIIDKMDELSARAFITRMECNTPSWCWISDMNPNYGMMQRENGGSEEGSLMHLFMAESGNHWGEERKAAKRKEPDSGLDPDDSGHSQLRLKL